MKSKESTSGVDRRGFLKTLSGGAAGTAAAATGVVAMSGTADAAESSSERTKKRYRETDHVKAYYRTNRY